MVTNIMVSFKNSIAEPRVEEPEPKLRFAAPCKKSTGTKVNKKSVKDKVSYKIYSEPGSGSGPGAGAGA
jgi:hypothetical protein